MEVLFEIKESKPDLKVGDAVHFSDLNKVYVCMKDSNNHNLVSLRSLNGVTHANGYKTLEAMIAELENDRTATILPQEEYVFRLEKRES